MPPQRTAQTPEKMYEAIKPTPGPAPEKEHAPAKPHHAKEKK